MKDFTTVLAKIQTAQNTIFSIEFIKKDGTVRNMVARLNVKKVLTVKVYHTIQSLKVYYLYGIYKKTLLE